MERSGSKRTPWIVLALILGVAAIVGVVSWNQGGNSRLGGLTELMQSAGLNDDAISETQLELVPKELGEKESEMDNAEILSDGGATEEDDVAIAKAEEDEQDADDKPKLVDETEDGEEPDDGQEETNFDDSDLELLSDDEAAKVVDTKEDRYVRRGCRRLRRCYRKFCRRCHRVRRRRRICHRRCYTRRYRGRVYRRCRVVRCFWRRFHTTHCRRTRCGVYCRNFIRCPPRVRCYNRYCVRRFCTRRCVPRRVCRRYRRCYRRCIGTCGRRYPRCYHRCYHYTRCKRYNRCFNHCFRRRALCGRRCVRTGRRPCRGNRNGVTYVRNKIVGCSGAFVGGVFGAQARNLCNIRGGWQICRNALQVRRLGLTPQICAKKSPANTFFGTQQRSTGNALCNNRGANDVFGCGNGRLFAVPNQRSCTPFNKFVGSWTNPASGWNCKGCHGYREALLFRKGPRNGGVLCCKVR